VSVAQFSQGDIDAIASGTGIDHKRPINESTISGTQIQCRSLFVGFA
jgi:hypothetical protein